MHSLSAIRCFVLDMDGTIYLGDTILPGALDFLNYLKSTNREWIFLTNNSSCSSDYYARKLTRMGWETDTSHILTSGEATALYLKGQSPGARVFLLGTEDLAAEFCCHGFSLTDENPQYVVLGFDKTLTYEKLSAACTFIRQGVPFIATHPDINCPTEEGFIPDCGALIACISASTGKTPYVIGKPHADIIEAIFRRSDYRSYQMAIVGDRLYTDIATGKNAGISSVLVLSGETQADEAAKATIVPDYIFKHLGELQKALEKADQEVEN